MKLSQQEKITPLPRRVRPTSLAQYHGHADLVMELKSFIAANAPKSIIFQGPPSSGKTTLAHLFINSFTIPHLIMNATDFSVTLLKERVEAQPRNVFVFIDEIHRLNKSQQDRLLTYVEAGKVSLIAATTEAVGASVNDALRSRVLIRRIEKLTPLDMLNIICDAVNHPKGLATELECAVNITQDAMNMLCTAYDGDARSALIALHSAALKKQIKNDSITIEVDDVTNDITYATSDSIMSEYVSAMIKSIRGSSVDGAIYYCAAMLELGQDPVYIARRLLVSADEDIGIACPMASTIALSCYNIVKNIGMPEARITLAKTVVYLASCPKDASCYKALDAALSLVKQIGPLRPPKHIRPGGFDSGEYHYPHATGSYNSQNYLPQEISSTKFYSPQSIPGLDIDYLFPET